MDFAELLLPALAVGATVLTGGAAAPAVAGAAEAGTAGALGAEAATAGATAAAEGAAGASGLTGLAGGVTAAPSGYASILQPLGGTSQGLGSGLTGAADPAIAAGSLGGQMAPTLPL